MSSTTAAAHQESSFLGTTQPVWLQVDVHEHKLSFRDRSAREFAEAEFDDHPMWIDTRELLDGGEWRSLRERVLTIFESANETPAAFCVSSRYIVAAARRT